MAKDATVDDDSDRVDVLLRVPRKTLAEIDAIAEAKKAPHTRANRNATILGMLDRGVSDARRAR